MPEIKGKYAMSSSYLAELEIMETGLNALYFHLNKIKDPRKRKGKRHKLVHILILTVIGVLRGHTDFANMVDDLKYDEQELTELLGLEHGIPSHDTFSRVFRIIDAKEFMHAFIDWAYSYIQLCEKEHIAFDGKAVRAACDKINGGNMPYIVNGYVCDRKLVLGQLRIDAKTNEIVGIPELMKLLDLEGCIVTIDAIGCQKNFCEILHNKGAGFVLPAKENQKLLHESILLYMQDAYAEWQKEEEQIKAFYGKGHKNKGLKIETPYHDMMSVFHEVDPKPEHGRKPGDRLYVTINSTSAVNTEQWPYVKAVGMTIRKRTEIKRKNGKDVSEESTEINTWILSEYMDARRFGSIVRSHWAIENSLHGVADQYFREDWCTARKDNATENLAQMRKICYNFINLDPAVKGKSKKAAFNYYRHNTKAVIDLIFWKVPLQTADR